MSTTENQLAPDSAKCRVVRPSGELDLATATSFGLDLNGWDALGGGIARVDAPFVVVDLALVTFMDLSPVRELCTARLDAERHGGWLRLVYTQRTIDLLLRAVRLTAMFPRHATVEDAIAGHVAVNPL